MTGFPTPPDERASLDLVARLRGGDGSAWDELYRRYHDQLLLVVRMRLGARLRAFIESEDIFQSAAREALSALARFEDRGPGSLQRYLQALVLNKIRDRADTFGAAKRQGAQPLDTALIESLAAPAGEPRYFDAACYERLERALRELPDDQREIVLLRKVDGLSSQEVAARTGQSDAAVRKATSRALARLAARLSE